MTLQAFGIIVGVVASVAGLFVMVIRVSVNQGRLNLKVDTLWEFMMRRAMAEAVKDGIAQKHSPGAVTEDSKEWMEPMKAELQAFYRTLGANMTDSKIAMAIEHKFGNKILAEICLPESVSPEIALLIAVAVAKEVNEKKG